MSDKGRLKKLRHLLIKNKCHNNQKLLRVLVAITTTHRNMIISLRDKQTVITNPEAIHQILQEVLKSEDDADQDREHFWIFQLDARQRIKQLELVSLGTLTMAVVHPREVFTKAVASRCNSIVVAHNHPSGDTEFSPQDIEVTKRLIEAGKILDIEVVDHVITTVNGYASYREQGLM